MPAVNDLVKAVARRAGLRITRNQPANRFDAMTDVLCALAAGGFAPTVVVDGGANVGGWTSLASRVFPSARYHLIEPQPWCQEHLHGLAATLSEATVHPFAVTAPGHDQVRLTGVGVGSTGAHVFHASEPSDSTTSVQARTLDDLVAPVLAHGDSVLLKLDLEGHELEALLGAVRLLSAVDVLISEVRFYDVERSGYPIFGDVMATAGRLGFSLYDVAALASRPSDGRLRIGDAVFARNGSTLLEDCSWA